MADQTTQKQPRSDASKKSKKKRAQVRQTSDNQDIDKVLAELSLGPSGPQPLAGDTLNPGPSPHKRFVALLTVSPQHLDGELEMRKFFGSKIVVSSKAASRTTSKRVAAAYRSTLTNPKPNWWPAQLREGLSIRQLTPDEREDKLFRYGWSERSEEVWWTVDYGKKYRAITMAFIQIVMSGGKQLYRWQINQPDFSQILRVSITSYVPCPIMLTLYFSSRKYTAIEKVSHNPWFPFPFI